MVKQKVNFAQSFAELEKIVAKFEQGEIDLDEALKEFERGLKLVQELKGRLKEVKNKVVVLKRKFGEEGAREEVDDEETDEKSKVVETSG